MYLGQLSVFNVRQFENRTFEFRPGFNLLVGENGAGKTTLLRALLAVFVRPNRKRQQSPLTDEDIRMGATDLKVAAQLFSSQGAEIGLTTYARNFGQRASRRAATPSPLVLWYSSVEATCGSFISRRIRKQKGATEQREREEEDWLYQQSVQSNPVGASEPSFGRSEVIRDFVLQVLERFSPRFRDFRWSFEPYDCSVRIPKGKAETLSPKIQNASKMLKSAVMRHFAATPGKFKEIDRASVVINSDGALVSDDQRDRNFEKQNIMPSFYDLLKGLQADEAIREISMQFTLEVRLTPRIQILDDSGNSYSLSQLSDGEQRLFSLFVDIARQLSLEMPERREFLEASAIVLIDEIDVHLHPKWQRMIVPALEDLFPQCQFIATTHSPFVVQAVTEQQLQHLNREIAGEFTDRGIEEIAVKVMGIVDHIVSPRYLEMLDVAKEYFTILEQAKKKNGAELEGLKSRLAELAHPYAENPAYQAYLELRKALVLKD